MSVTLEMKFVLKKIIFLELVFRMWAVFLPKKVNLKKII
jgi:hypothetical protein